MNLDGRRGREEKMKKEGKKKRAVKRYELTV